MVYRRKQDPVSEQDNKAQRPARRQERADCDFQCVFLYLQACVYFPLYVNRTAEDMQSTMAPLY